MKKFFILACNEDCAFFASEEHKKYDLWSCQKVTDALIYLQDNIYIFDLCYVLDTQLNKVGSSSELIYFLQSSILSLQAIMIMREWYIV